MNSQNPHGRSGGPAFDRERERERDAEERQRALPQQHPQNPQHPQHPQHTQHTQHTQQQHQQQPQQTPSQQQQQQQQQQHPPPPPPPQQQQQQHLPQQSQHQQHDDMRRDQDREREMADRYPPAPHQSSASSLPIHQPVASRISGAIHSPGGLLANHNGPPPAPAPAPGPAPASAPGSHMGGPPVHAAANFGGPMPGDAGRQMAHGAQQGAGGPHQVFAPGPHPQGHHSQGPPGPPQSAPGSAAPVYGGGQQPPGQQQQHQAPPPPPQQQQQQQQQQHPPPAPSSQAPAAQQSQDGQRGGKQAAPGINIPPTVIPSGITQGQQPILNDALTYLDQVKVQFHDQPDVYNRFLDIMKDFKSQTIDTPGVINRVSELFAGHPNLIQGFNTFLPPGYRIECGAGNDPNSIRVTTPMGTTVQSIAGRGPGESHGPGGSQIPFPDRGGPGGGAGQWQQQQRGQPAHESPEAGFSTTAQSGASLFVQAAAQNAAFEASAAQRNAAQTGAAAGPVPRGPQTPGPGGAGGNQANMERRGPVEFNHAISYVNKIKNRFQDKPEIYKQFLEILQTYQREQKPIQDVYAQVTTLFNSAPDLLEDFKQFLPESAGQAKAAQARLEEAMAPGLSHTPQPGPRDGHKMPPLGSFAPPPSASKDKKRQRMDKQAPGADALLAEPGAAGRLPSGVNGNKRAKLSHVRGGIDPTAPIEPALTPVMPEPYPARRTAYSTHEQVAFFERVKKFLSNRSSMVEFLKLCNLFTQNIIDKTTLYHKGAVFLGANPDLMTFWKDFVEPDSRDVIVENQPAPPTEKLSLSNCRGYGPSYRLLPKRERLKPCSGRDDLCNSVLNDQWASHPTWASEDSGFVAHRKNQFEEGLHRIEEERHDYDFNIEINLKCIQLLEPVAQQMLAMSQAERDAFHMPAALAGQSTSIFKRVCKKIYGDKGVDVVNDLFSHPFNVVPILLTRMKQKDEEWRFSQREWEKVWHAQTEHMYLKSLDHMGILVKSNDKRNLTAKHLIDVIKTKHEEQRREKSLKGKAVRHQLVWDFGDKDVILDLLRLMMLYPMHSGQYSVQEKERIADFFESFITAFFDLNEDLVQERVPKLPPDSAEEEVEDAVPAELTNGRGGGGGGGSSRRNGRKGDLLRGVLDPVRNGVKPRCQKEETTAAGSAGGSKETTPDIESANEEEMPDAPDDAAAAADLSNQKWMTTMPKPTVMPKLRDVSPFDDVSDDEDFRADSFFRRPWYNFFANQTIFVFFSIFQTVYTRLVEVKASRDMIAREIERRSRPKPADDIGFADTIVDFFLPGENPDKFWSKTLDLIEDYITGEIEEPRYQEVLRLYYLRSGWKLYTIQDQLRTLCRLALTCSSNDAKEKTPDLIHQYLLSREKEETSFQTEISARKFAEKCVKDGDLFVICWFPQRSEATVRWLQRNETTFYLDEMQMRERWQYYISSFVRMEPTEGVRRSLMQKVMLMRNLQSGDTDSDSGSSSSHPAQFSEKLTTSICLKSHKMLWEPGTSEYFISGDQVARMAPTTTTRTEEARQLETQRRAALSERRAAKVRQDWIEQPLWAADLAPGAMDERNAFWRRLVDGSGGSGW